MGYFDSLLNNKNEVYPSVGNCVSMIIDEEGSSYVSSDVDLSQFRLHDELNPKVWNGRYINSRVRLRLLDIADDFIDFLSVDWVKPIDIILTGSLANFNWSKYSDFDVHVLYDFEDIDERTEFVKEFFNSKKNEWNNNHDNLSIFGFPVEMYVQDINEEHTASGVYSLERNEWLRIPERDKFRSIQLDKFYIKDKVSKYINKILALEDNPEPNKVKALFDKIKDMRRVSLRERGEMSPGNIIYKCLRRLGYIERLINLKYDAYDKINSIEN